MKTTASTRKISSGNNPCNQPPVAQQILSESQVGYIDDLDRSLSQASAIPCMLTNDGLLSKERFHSNHSTVMETLWAVEDLLKMAQEASSCAWGARPSRVRLEGGAE